MKTKPRLNHNLLPVAACLATSLLLPPLANASPYASNVRTNGAGSVYFVMNEDGATVTVKYDDATTYPMGVLPKGQTNFPLGVHSGFSISCFKQGTGIPSIISSDAVGVYTYSNSVWNSPRGVAVNKNPKNGANFGRLLVGNSAFGTQSSGPKGKGLYLLNADQTYVAGPVGSNYFAGSGTSGPYRIRANADGTFLVSDFSTANASLLQFSPDLSSSNLVLSIIGETPAVAAGIHGDMFGCGLLTGSLAQSNLVLYTFDSGLGAPGDTNCIKGPLTSPGSYNCVFKYNIGAGPLPWNKRPDYAYTYGLDGIAELRTEGDVGPDGKVYCAFGRANASDPNLQILSPVPTTNGIAGDPFNANVQEAAKSATNWLYTGGVVPPFNTPPPGGAAGDPWVGSNGSGSSGGTYAGVRISPDGTFIASVDINNGVTLANLTNGIPNEGTLFGINQSTYPFTAPAGITGVGANTGNSRGMDWDAADNVWVISSGQGLLRCFSLGLTTTCVTSNDWTGTNGTFNLIVPPLQASIAVINATASQNYVNNSVNAGTPIPGVIRISLATNDTTSAGPVTVGFVRSGTALYTNNYTINTNETPNGVTITPTNVIFPAGLFAGSNGPNWNVDVKFIPTPLPISGGTSNINVRLVSGANYSAAAPLSGNISVLNTGPQLLQLVAAAPSTLGGMNRGIPNDYALFTISRLGDLNGPGNDAVNPIVQRSVTITNVDFLAPAAGANFLARLGVDFTAGAQAFTGSAPVDGSSGIVISPGSLSVSALIGNPVKHLNPNLIRTNLQVVISLTNTAAIGSPASTTNVLSAEGFQYSVTTGTLTLNEFDNANGGEVVLWSNPLISASDSTNWTLVYASINQGASPTLPTVFSNYDNSATAPGDYTAWFGKSVLDPANDGGVSVPQSATMIANGWTNALKVTVNKSPADSGESGVNLYPQIPGAPWTGSNYVVFQGNYALRFDMYLSLYDFGLNNPVIGTPAREFAAFGINHYGTNANWRLDINPRADGTGARPINADGEWCTIGAASGSITPADYDLFVSPAWALFDTNGVPLTNTVPFTTNLYVGVPFTNAYQISPGVYSGQTNVFANAGVPNDQQSANNNSFGGAPQNGIIKDPPFSGINNLGGAPDNAWVDVSLELTRQTNLTLLVAQQPLFNTSTITPVAGTANPIAPFGGTPMLGYLDPNRDISDYSAFVYYSNLRIVELSPFIPWTNQPIAGLIVTQGSSFSLSSGATFASNPLTNKWFVGSTNGPGVAGSQENGTPLAAVATNVFSSTNGIATLAVNSLQSGTNYISTWSDAAGSITNYTTVVEVIAGPGNPSANAGATTSLVLTPSGNAPPTSYRWTRGGTNLVAGVEAGRFSSFGGVTSPTLTITNVQPQDAGVYSCLVTNAYGSVTSSGTLTVLGAIVNPVNRTNLWGSTASFTVSAGGTGPFTYQWKKGGVDLTDGGNVSGSTSSTLTLSPVTRADQASYTAGVTNAGGGVISSAGNLWITVPAPHIQALFASGGSVQLAFTSTNAFDTTNAFILQRSAVVQGPYTNYPGAVFSTNGSPGGFEVSLPQNAGENTMFYRLLHLQ